MMQLQEGLGVQELTNGTSGEAEMCFTDTKNTLKLFLSCKKRNRA